MHCTLADNLDEVLAALEAGMSQLMLPCHHIHSLGQQPGEHEITGVIAIRQHDVSGTWDFRVIRNDGGQVTGWNVFFDGALAGLLVLHGENLTAFVTSREEDESAPSADQIMVAFLAGPGRDRR